MEAREATELPEVELSQMEKLLLLSEENNRLLKHMQFIGRISFWIKVAVWALVLGLPVLFFSQFTNFTRGFVLEHSALFGVPVQQSGETFSR